MAQRNRHGFTLMEVMVTIGLIAVIASMAVPSYVRTVQEQRVNQAVSILRTIRYAERSHFLDHDTYTTDWTVLPMRQPNSDDFTFTLSSASAANFQATATQVGNPNCVLTIDGSGAITGCGLSAAAAAGVGGGIGGHPLSASSVP